MPLPIPFPRLFSRKRLSTVLLLCVAISVLIYVVRRPGVTVSDETLEVNGLSRAYRLVIPQSRSNNPRLPLVVAFHGALDRTDEMAGYTGLDELSAEKRFLLVYPAGRHQNWPPLIPEENPHIMQPDVDFFRAICDHMVTHHRADPDRIYVLGVSQGGAMSTVITAFCSDLIAATICNCGWLPRPLGEQPLPTSNKCPMLFIVGENDRQVTPESTREAHDAFAAVGHPVEFLVVPNHGHGWPLEHNINEVAWDFFSKHQRLVSNIGKQ